MKTRNLIWDFSKEAHNEKNLAYKQGWLKYLRETDPYQHLRTVHDDNAAYDSGAYDGLCDFRADQQHGKWRETILTQRAQREWPVVNVEFQYEPGPGGLSDKTYGGGHSTPEESLRRVWEIALAGGYTAYYCTYTAWDVIRPLDVPTSYAYFRHFGDFWRATEYWRLEPSEGLVRAVLACGVYLNDRYTFNRGVALWQQYVESTLRETGQIAETLRDVPHCHCLLALQVEGAEIAWHQGLDLYAAKNHGLKSALELHAALCLGMLDKVKNKPDTSWGSRTPEQVWGKGVPGEGFAAYEIGYNHFANRLKMDLPLTTQYLQKARPIYTYRGTGTAITLTYQQSKPEAQPPLVPARPSEAMMPAPPVPPLMQPSRAAPATGETGATNQPPRASKRGEE